jgi:DNA primase
LRDFEETKRKILDRVDLFSIVSEHVALKRSGRRWIGLCPFHAEKTPSFTVRPEHGSFKCFGCGKGGDVFSFVQIRENVPFIEAMRILADRAGVDLEGVTERTSSGPGRADLARVNAWAQGYFRARLQDARVGRAAREYLRERGLSDTMVDRFGLGFAADDTTGLREAAARAGVDLPLLLAADLLREAEGGRLYATFRSRLMFPIRDVTRRVIGFGGRTLVGDRAKYINTRQNALFDKGRNLYGVDLARDAMVKRGRAVIVEGYTDCLAAHQYGFDEVVATLGTALTESQVDLLRRYVEVVILLFDSDEAGREAADRAVRVALPRCVTVRLARLPDGKDPGDFLSSGDRAGAFSDVLNGAADALEFKWLDTLRRFSGGGSTGARRQAVEDFLGVIAEACGASAVDVIQRGLLVNQVAHLLRMNRADVDRLLTRRQGRRPAARGVPDTNNEEVCAPPADEEQAAWVRVLEVLLGDPDAAPIPDPFPDSQRIVDDRDRRVAETVIGLIRDRGSFTVPDVLARCEDSADAARVEVLARRGAARGNFERTVELALECLRRAEHDAALAAGSAPARLAEQERLDSGESRDRLVAFAQQVRGHRHFVPRGRRRGRCMSGVPEEGSKGPQTSEES